MSQDLKGRQASAKGSETRRRLLLPLTRSGIRYGNWLSQLQEHPYVLPGGAQLSLRAEGEAGGLENLGKPGFRVFVGWLEAWKKRCEELRHDSFAAVKTEWRIGHRLPRRTTRWEPFLL